MTASKPMLNGGFRNSTKMLGCHDESGSLWMLEIVTAFTAADIEQAILVYLNEKCTMEVFL